VLSEELNLRLQSDAAPVHNGKPSYVFEDGPPEGGARKSELIIVKDEFGNILELLTDRFSRIPKRRE